MSAALRVVIAGLYHETHTFLSRPTSLSAFSALAPDESGPSQLAGALTVARESGWTVALGPYWLATPSGIVEDEVLERWWEQLAPLLPEADGVHLDLHGAMVTRSFSDAEGEILRRVREITDVPMSVALDLHGNMTERMCLSNLICTGYRKNPHTDTQATTLRAARLLARVLVTGERPSVVRVQPALLWPPTGTGTDDEPMRSLEDRARALERSHPELLDVSVFGGFAFADIPESGLSFLATTLGDPDHARSLLEELSGQAQEQKEAALQPRVALENLTIPVGDSPFLLVEPSDNVGGGAPGDATHVLRWLLEREIQNAGVCLCDPEAVAQLSALRDGESLVLGVGAKSGEWGVGTPVVGSVTKLRASDGAYTLADPNSHNAAYGRVQQMGPSVLAQLDGVTLLLTSLPTAPMDLGPWFSLGVDPAKFSAINVKAAVAHRRAYDPIASGSVRVDVPGPCDEKLSRLPYQHIRRPVWPLDNF
jgi:microcystin degradation protein MlrC